MLIGFSFGGVVPLIIMVALAAGYAALATWLARRWGRVVFLPLWILASVLAATGLLLEPLDGVAAPTFMARAQALMFSLLIWSVAFGVITYYIFRRWRRGATTFGPGVALLSVAGFLGASILTGLAYVLWDLRSHFL